MADQNVTQDPPFYTEDKKAGAKANFEEQKQKLLNNPDFQKFDDQKKQAALSMFFDKYGINYMKQSGVEDPELIKGLKLRWTGDTFNEIKGVVPDPVEPEKKRKVERAEDPTVLPDWLTDGASIYQEIPQPADKLQSAPLRDPESEASVKAHYEKLQSEIPSITENLLNSEEFGYMKSRPDLYIKGGEQSAKDVDKWLKKNTDLSYGDRNHVQNYLAARSNDEMAKDLRKKYRGNLDTDMEEAAQPFIEEFDDGSFLDPETDERVKEPQTKEAADFLSMQDKASNELLSLMLMADTQNPINQNKVALDEEFTALEEEANTIREMVDQEATWKEGLKEGEADEEYINKYNDWITNVNKANTDYSKKVEQYNEKTKKFNEDLQKLPQQAPTRKSLKNRLTEAVQDSYLKWQHYNQQYNSAKRQYEGEEEALKAPSLKTLNQLNKLRYQAKAEFIAGSRMLYNQEGPLQIDREDGYKAELFTTAVTRNMGPGKISENLSHFDEPRQQEILQSMYQVGQAAGVPFTDEELDAFESTIAEDIVSSGGALVPKLPELILLGYSSGAVKGALNLSKFTKGYQIIKNKALGRAIVTPLGETPGQGWTVVKTFNPNTFQKVAGTVASGMIDEAVFTAGGFQFGAITGMNAAHQIMPDIKFRGKWQMFNPVIDMFYKAGVGATTGMEAGQSAAGLVEAALTDRPIDDIFHEMYPSVTETSKRILEEFVVNTMLFGGQGAIMKSTAKAKSAPAGMQFNRFGMANWTGYIDPRVRNRYREAAKEFESKGFTDTATEIYKWLDIYDGPLKATEIKEGRIENLKNSLEILPDGQIREMRDVYQLMIKVLEYQGRQPDFTGTIEAPIRTYDDVREGSVVNTKDYVPVEGGKEGDPKWETVSNHWEVVKRDNAANGAPVRYEAIHTETGEKRVFEAKTTETQEGKRSYFEFDPKVSIKLQNSLQVPFMLEAAYEHYNVLNGILAGRKIDPKIEKLPPGPQGPQTPPGVDIPVPSPPTKISRKREEIAEREKLMLEETGKEPIPLEPPKKEYTLGDPEEILDINAREFSDKLATRVDDMGGQLETLRGNIATLQEQLSTDFKGRLTLEQRKKKEEVQNDIIRTQNAIDKSGNEFDGELREWLDLAKPTLSTAITDMAPGTGPDVIEEILDNLWDKMVRPTEEEADMTVSELLQETVNEREGAVKAPKEEPTPPAIDKKKALETKHDRLLSRVRQYNELPKNQKRKASTLYQMIGKAVADLGYTVGMKGDELVVMDEEGKPIRMTAMRTPKEEIEAHPLLTEYEDPGFIDFVSRIIEVPESLMSYDAPLKPSEIKQGIKNIKEGKKTVAANNLLDALEESMEEGVIVLKETRNTPREEIPIDEFNDLVAESNFQNFTKKYGELGPDNIDEAVKLGLMSEEEKNQYLKNLEDEIKKEAEPEEEPGPEPGEERPVDTEGEGAGEEAEQVKVGDQVVLPEGYISLAAGTEGRITKLSEKDGELHATLDLGKNKSGQKLTRDVPVQYLKKAEAKPLDVAEDLKAMEGLLGDIDFDLGPVEAAGGTAKPDPKVAMLTVATGLVKKFADNNIYGFDEILKAVIPSLSVPKIKALLPFFKQGYMAFIGTATPEVQAKMDVQRAMTFDIADLEKMVQPEEPVEPPEQPVEPPVPTEDEKRKQDLIDAKIMEPPVEHIYQGVEDVLKIVDTMVKRGEPLRNYIEKYVPKDLMQKVMDLHNQVAQLYAQLGYAGVEAAPNYLPLEISPRYLITPLYLVGSKGRNFDRGEEDGYYTQVQKAIDNLQKKVTEGFESLAITKQLGLTMDIKNHIWNGKEFPLEGYNGIVKLANGIWDVNSKADIRDSYELALVEIARSMAMDTSKPVNIRYVNILNLYQKSPNISLTARTSTVKELQQYSTPVPISFLMGEYVNAMDVDGVLEPQAGVGSLLVNAKKGAVRANELDPKRFRRLLSQGYRTFNKDSSHGLKGTFDIEHFSAVLMNLAFGGPGEDYNGIILKGEYVGVAYNLESMADNGKAAIIVGGHIKFDDKGRMVKGGKDVLFFNWAAKHYNIEDIIQIPGEFYKGMGAEYPIKMILINGRKAAPEGAAPLYSEKFEPVQDWTVLRDRILNLKTKPNEKSVLQSKLDAVRGSDSIMDGDDTGRPQDTGPRGVGGVREEEDIVTGPGGGPPVGEKPVEKPVGGDTGKWGPGAGGSNIESPGIPKPTFGIKSEDPGPKSSGFGKVPSPKSPEDLPISDFGKPTERTLRELKERTGDEVTPYIPLSRMGGKDYVVPASLAPFMDEALKQLNDEIGDVDEYVRLQLGYNSKEDLKQALFAGQIDGIAQGIFNITAKEAMIIGHQTGAGKGRVAAGIASYAIENGMMPVFITKKAKLFTDIFRDFIGIGRPDYVPFIMNKQFPDTGQKVRVLNMQTGAVLHEANARQIDEIVGKGDQDGTFELPPGTDMLFTTYSQFANEEGSKAKRRFLNDLAQRNDVIFIMDESHGAAGMSNTGDFFKDWTQLTKGGMFLSATYAKRPDNMPLYAMKTVMREANMPLEALVEAIQAGGPALQEIITTQLAEAGQFSKLGIQLDATMNYHILGDTDPTQKTYNPELGKEMVVKYDAVTDVIREIIHFQKVYINPILDGMDESIKKQGKFVTQRKGTKEAGIANQPYFSRVWNVIDQLLYSLKSTHVVPLVIEDLQKGIKPVITFRNTMEAVFKEMEKDGLLKKGDIIDMDFSYILKRGMNTVMKYTETDEQGIDHKKFLQPEDLDDITRAKYFDLMEMITETATGIPLSPIDVLRKGIQDAGFEYVEVTGRDSMFELSDDLTKGKYVKNDKGDAIKAVWNFNNNPGYAALMNSSGAEGVSMHPLADNLDHSPVSMYSLQMMLDINEAIQLFGRIGRVGQIHKPTYNIVSSALPAEKRMFMMMAKKLKSLDANTSGNQKQSSNMIDVPDFLNKYGDGVVIEFLKENPEINDLIGDPFKILGAKDEKDIDKEDAAHKATGRIQVLPSEMQEYFNNEVVERYLQTIEYLNATGQNDLMVTNEPLKAKELGSDMVIEGHGGFSKFGDNTNLRTYEVDVLNKPYTKAQLDAELAKVPENHQKDTIDAMEKGLQERLETAIEKEQKFLEERKTTTRKRIFDKKNMSLEDKEREWNLKEAELDKFYDYKVDSHTEDVDALRTDFYRAMSFFNPGRIVDIPFATTDAADITRLNQGAFLSFGIDMNKTNPWVPSNIMLKFATLDSRKMFRIPMSKMAHVELIMRLSSNISSYEQTDVMENWDFKKKGRQREKRYIITENVMQGMYQYSKGRLINFTLEDGTIKEGILMPENWKKPDINIYKMPIGKGKDIIRKLHPGGFVEDYSGDILIKKLPYNDYSPHLYELRVPASSQRGKKYWSNDQLKELMRDDFEQRGDRMVAEFPEDRLDAVIDLLDQRFKIQLETEGAQVQNAHDATESHAMQGQYSTGPRKKAKDRGGLSNPEVEPIGVKNHPYSKRIVPSPISGEKPKNIDEIVFNIGAALGGKNVAFLHRPAGKKRAAGVHFPLTNMVAIKYANDMDTTAHEIGHYMDKLFGILGPEAYDVMEQLREDFQHLWDYGSKPGKDVQDPDMYRMREGLAEFVRALVVNPAETKRRFPNSYSWFKERVSKNQAMWDALEQFSRDVRIWHGSDNLDKVGTNMDLDLRDKKPPPLVFSRTNREGLFQSTLFDKLGNRFWFIYESGVVGWKWAMRQQGIDPEDPKQVSPLMNFEYLVRNLLGFDVKIQNIDQKGLVDFNNNRVFDDVSGEPLSWDLWLRSIPSHDWHEADANLKFALKVAAAYRGKEIPGKLAAKQARIDLSAGIDKIPPLEILQMEHQAYNRVTYKGKIDKVLRMIVDGDLTEEEAFWDKERYLRFRDGDLVGLAQEDMRDYDILEGAVEEFEALEKTHPDTFRWVSEFMRVGQLIGDWYVDYALEAGLITQDVRDKTQLENLYFLIMRRALAWSAKDSVDGIDNHIDPYTTSGDEIPRITMPGIKGSKLKIKHPFAEMVAAVHNLINMADYNYVILSFAQAFTGTLNPDPLMIPRNIGELAVVRDVPGEGGIYFKYKGQDRWLVIRDKEVARTFKQLVKTDNPILKLISAIPRTLQRSIVTAYQFMLRNAPRDLGGYLIYGADQKHQNLWKDLRFNEEKRDLFELFGGGQFGYVITGKKGYKKLVNDLMIQASKDPKKWIYNPWAWVRWKGEQFNYAAGMSERFTRMLQFKAAFRKAKEVDGLGDAAAATVAAFKARDLTDFQAAGEYVKFLNQFIIFSGAAIRGLEKVARSTRQDPKRMAKRFTLFSLLPAMMVPVLIEALASDEQKERYINLPDYLRDMFYMIPAGDGWLMIPKPFELGAVASAGQRLLDMMILGDENAFSTAYMKSFHHMMNPYDMAGVAGGYGGIIAVTANRDFFRQKYIIPPSEEKLALVKRNTETASRLGQDLQKITRKDARLMDAFVLGQFAYWGDLFIKAYENVRNIGSGKKVRRRWQFDAEDLSLFKRDQVFGTPNVQWVMKESQKYPDEFGYITNQAIPNFRKQLRYYMSDDVQNNNKLRMSEGVDVRFNANLIREAVEDFLEKKNTTLDDMAKEIKDYENWVKNK